MSSCPASTASVAVGPRFPESYTSRVGRAARMRVAVGPRFPESYTHPIDCLALPGVAVGPRFPESYTSHPPKQPARLVAVGPRFPESYTGTGQQQPSSQVAVGPRFPESYTPYSYNALFLQGFFLFLAGKNMAHCQNKTNCSGFLRGESRVCPRNETIRSYCLSVKHST